MAYIGNQPASAFASTEKQTITGNGTAGPYALTHEVAAATDIACFVNNVRQEPGVAYTVSGNQMTMTGNVASTDDFYVVYIGRVVGTVAHPANSGLAATSGTFSGDLTVNTNTLHVDATNNRVGVGTTSPAIALETSGSLAVSDTTTATKRLQMDGGASSHTINSANYGSDMMDLNIQAENLVIKTGLIGVAERARFPSSGGITFNGDTAAANALDSYEEGTFTPATTVGTITAANAAYTKVGRKVTVHFNAYNFSNRSATNHIEFTNMPFTSDSSIGSTANSGMHRYVNAGHSLAFYMPRNQSKIQLFSLNSGSGWTPTQYSHLNSTSAEMYIHLTYFTAS